MKERKEDPHRSLQITSVVNKAMLAIVRSGDYQHPGEAEAIELIFKGIDRNPDQLVLDVGCGRGGTADYIFKNGWGKVIGIDINPEIVDTANKNFGQHFAGDIESLEKGPAFFDCDALDVEEFMFNKFQQKLKFDVICMVSSFFLFPAQEKSLIELRKVANKNTQLAIFDYIDYGEYRKHDYKENGRTLMPYLYDIPKIRELLHASGWQIDSMVNLDEENIRWYQDLVQRIESRKEGIVAAHGKEAFECFTVSHKHMVL